MIRKSSSAKMQICLKDKGENPPFPQGLFKEGEQRKNKQVEKLAQRHEIMQKGKTSEKGSNKKA